jgi:hypothetical protein
MSGCLALKANSDLNAVFTQPQPTTNIRRQDASQRKMAIARQFKLFWRKSPRRLHQRLDRLRRARRPSLPTYHGIGQGLPRRQRRGEVIGNRTQVSPSTGETLSCQLAHPQKVPFRRKLFSCAAKSFSGTILTRWGFWREWDGVPYLSVI